MSTETAEPAEAGTDPATEHLRGIAVTALASLAGIAAALVSAQQTQSMGLDAADAAGAIAPKIALLVAIILQFPILRAMGYDPNDFSAKDVLYIAFMTFALWFVSWGVVLSSGATI